jgi:phage tail-like protein
MTNAINQRGALATDPIRNFRFLVTFFPLVVAEGIGGWTPNPQVGFTSVSGLAISTESIPYREGGFNTSVHQIPGQSTFSPVTFQRGVTIGTSQHWDWMRMLFQTVSGDKFSNNTSFRADVEIAVLNHPVPYSRDPGGAANSGYGGTTNQLVTTLNDAGAANDDKVVAKFRLYNAWPTSVAYSDLNAGDNALMVEQMTLVHEGMDMAWASVDPQSNTINAAAAFSR